MRDGWRADINLHAGWKTSRQSAHSRGPLNIPPIILMTSNSVLAPCFLFPSLTNLGLDMLCKQPGHCAPCQALYPARRLLATWKLQLMNEGLLFIVVFGNLALMTRREKWPLPWLEWPWIISFYLSLSPSRASGQDQGQQGKIWALISRGILSFLSYLHLLLSHSSLPGLHLYTKIQPFTFWTPILAHLQTLLLAHYLVKAT